MSNMKKIKEIDEVEWNKEDSGLILPKTNDLITRIDTKKSFIEPNEKINPIRNKVKCGTDNLTLILLIPSLLGAIWQILSLAKIHVGYIRFFSPTQIPVDGALILFIVLVFYLVIKFGFTLVKNVVPIYIKRAKEKVEDLNANYSTLKIKAIINIIIVIMGFGTFVYLFDLIFPTDPIKAILITGFFMTGIFLKLFETIIFMYSVLRYRNKTQNFESRVINFINKKDDSESEFWDLATVLLIVIPAIVIYISLSSFNYFNNIFMLSNNLENSKSIQEKIVKDYKAKYYKVRYMNDKYIFIQLCPNLACDDKKNEKIVMLQTEKTLFKD